MIEVLGLKLTYEAVVFLALFILSEVIGASKLKENAVFQLVKNAIDSFRGVRKEDEVVEGVKEAIEGAAKAVKGLGE